jgi:hypothetical protein
MSATERDEWIRAAWRVTVAGKIDPRRLVFVDEMGTNTSLSFSAVRLLPEGEKGLRAGPTQPWSEHHAACEHESRGNGSVLGSGRRHHR